MSFFLSIKPLLNYQLSLFIGIECSDKKPMLERGYNTIKGLNYY
jgi:hypothetical protein